MRPSQHRGWLRHGRRVAAAIALAAAPRYGVRPSYGVLIRGADDGSARRYGRSGLGGADRSQADTAGGASPLENAVHASRQSSVCTARLVRRFESARLNGPAACDSEASLPKGAFARMPQTGSPAPAPTQAAGAATVCVASGRVSIRGVVRGRVSVRGASAYGARQCTGRVSIRARQHRCASAYGARQHTGLRNVTGDRTATRAR
jgi:hypothetical protein